MKTFILTLAPKNENREILLFFFIVVEAQSEKAAKLLAPEHWPVGAKSYQKLTCRAFLSGYGYCL